MQGLVLRIGGGLLLLVAAFTLPSNLCGNQVLREEMSPNKINRVVVFERNCGATTGLSRQASIIKANEALDNEAGNLFVFGDEEKSGAIDFEWTDDHHLTVRHSKFVHLSKIEEVRGVKLKYEVLP
jgi:hypothetical protein